MGIIIFNPAAVEPATVLSPRCGDYSSRGSGSARSMGVLSPRCGDYFLSVLLMENIKGVLSPRCGDYFLILG